MESASARPSGNVKSHLASLPNPNSILSLHLYFSSIIFMRAFSSGSLRSRTVYIIENVNKRSYHLRMIKEINAFECQYKKKSEGNSACSHHVGTMTYCKIHCSVSHWQKVPFDHCASWFHHLAWWRWAVLTGQWGHMGKETYLIHDVSRPRRTPTPGSRPWWTGRSGLCVVFSACQQKDADLKSVPLTRCPRASWAGLLMRIRLDYVRWTLPRARLTRTAARFTGYTPCIHVTQNRRGSKRTHSTNKYPKLV